MKKFILSAVMICLCMTAMCQNSFKGLDTENMKKAGLACDSNDFETAMIYIDRELEQNSENGYGWYFKAFCMPDIKEEEQIGMLENAIKYMDKKDIGRRMFSYNTIGSIYEKAGMYDKAIKFFMSALKLGKFDYETLDNVVCCYMNMKNEKKAAKYAKRMILVDPYELRGYFLMAHIEYYQNHTEEALSICDAILEKKYYMDGVHGLKAAILLGMGINENAIDETITEYLIDTQDSYPMFLLKMYLSYEETSMYTLAKLRVCNSIYPELSDITSLIADFYFDSDQYDKAIDYYKTLAEQFEDDTYYLSQIELCHSNMYEYDIALDICDSMLRMDSVYEQYVYYRKSDIYYNMGDLNNAIYNIDKAIAANAEVGFMYYLKGWYMEFDENPDTAAIMDNYNMAMQLDSELDAAFMFAGKIYLAQGKTEEANKCFDNVIEINSKEDNSNILTYVDFIDFYRGNYERAEKNVETKLAANKEDNLYNAACMYSLMGKKDMAMKYLELYFKTGAKNFYYVIMDHDFDNIENAPEFKALIERYKK